jgi:hypothetical protein
LFGYSIFNWENAEGGIIRWETPNLFSLIPFLRHLKDSAKWKNNPLL